MGEGMANPGRVLVKAFASCFYTPADNYTQSTLVQSQLHDKHSEAVGLELCRPTGQDRRQSVLAGGQGLGGPSRRNQGGHSYARVLSLTFPVQHID